MRRQFVVERNGMPGPSTVPGRGVGNDGLHTDPPGWLGSLVAALGCFAYVFIVLPWAMRRADLRRRRKYD